MRTYNLAFFAHTAYLFKFAIFNRTKSRSSIFNLLHEFVGNSFCHLLSRFLLRIKSYTLICELSHFYLLICFSLDFKRSCSLLKKSTTTEGNIVGQIVVLMMGLAHPKRHTSRVIGNSLRNVTLLRITQVFVTVTHLAFSLPINHFVQFYSLSNLNIFRRSQINMLIWIAEVGLRLLTAYGFTILYFYELVLLLGFLLRRCWGLIFLSTSCPNAVEGDYEE